MSNPNRKLREGTASPLSYCGVDLDRKTLLAVDLRKSMIRSDKVYHQKRRLYS